MSSRASSHDLTLDDETGPTRADIEALKRIYPCDDTEQSSDGDANPELRYRCDGCRKVCHQAKADATRLNLIPLSPSVAYATIV